MAEIKHWLSATRPKTLPASLIPVVVGSSLAIYFGYSNLLISAIALVCAVLIQIITNYINEIYDFKKGADSGNRLGPQRMVAAGIISLASMRNVTFFLVALTFSLGMFLVYKAGFVILILGIMSLLFAYCYTGGPFPLAYKGVADIFVLIFFGFVAVCGTFYALTGFVNIPVFLAATAPGLFSMNILGVNNIRDIETDRIAQKNTLAVRLGRDRAIPIYVILNYLAFLSSFFLAVYLKNIFVLLPVLSVIYSIKIIKDLKSKKGSELNSVLAGTGKLLLIHGFLTSLGIILARFSDAL